MRLINHLDLTVMFRALTLEEIEQVKECDASTSYSEMGRVIKNPLQHYLDEGYGRCACGNWAHSALKKCQSYCPGKRIESKEEYINALEEGKCEGYRCTNITKLRYCDKCAKYNIHARLNEIALYTSWNDYVRDWKMYWPHDYITIDW